MFHSSKNNRGFTLIELLVSISIVVVILTTVILNQSQFTDTTALSNLANEIGQRISQAQAYGIGVKEFSPGTNDFSASYGVAFSILSSGSRTAYIFFADRNANKLYEGDWTCPTGGTSECLEKTDILRGNYIQSICIIATAQADLCTVGRLDVSFLRPHTETQLMFFDSNGTPLNPSGLVGARVILQSPKGSFQTVSIYVTGQISIAPNAGAPYLTPSSGYVTPVYGYPAPVGYPTPAAQTWTLSVAKAGTGSGTVTGNGINCGGTCTRILDDGTLVTLTATPIVGDTFTGWSGACTGMGSCVTVMTADKSVTATFLANPAQNISWIRAVGVSTSGNSLTKTAGTGWASQGTGVEAGASSNQMLSSGDGYVEFTTTEINTPRMAGLSHNDPDVNIPGTPVGASGMQYSWGPSISNVLYVLEPDGSGNRVVRYTGTYAVNDLLRVAVESGQVKYYQNGTLRYTNTSPGLVYPLLFDAALYNTGATISGAKISGNIITDSTAPVVSAFDVQPRTGASTVAATFTVTDAGFQHLQRADLRRAPYNLSNCNASTASGCAWAVVGTRLAAVPVTWTNSAGVTSSGNSLTKSAAVGWGNAGAASVERMNSGDGYVQFAATETNKYRMAGLSNGDPDQNFAGIDYAWYPAQSSVLYVIENGANMYTGTYATGDVFRIAVESGVVKYYQNGLLRYTSLVAPVYPLLFDSALYDVGSTITDAKMSSAVSDSWSQTMFNTPATGATYVYGLQVYDNAGNIGIEPARIEVTSP